MKILGRRHTTVSVSPGSHLAGHMSEAERRGEELHLATAIGVPEHVVIAAAAALPPDVDEMAYAGALVGRPLAMRRCALSALRVPAQVEVVMEGALLPGVRVADGPYMDYAGVANVNRSAYVYEVRRLAVRKGLVFRGTAVGVPGGEDHRLFSLLAAAGLADFHGSRLRKSVQNLCLRHRWYRLLQSSGRVGRMLWAGGR
jgi:2,5-furandicarboxylate decarboxylase 1